MATFDLAGIYKRSYKKTIERQVCFRLSAAARLVGVSTSTVLKWKDDCPYLFDSSGKTRGITFHPDTVRDGVYERTIDWFVRRDLIDIRSEQVQRGLCPKYPGYTCIDDAEAETGVSRKTLWRTSTTFQKERRLRRAAFSTRKPGMKDNWLSDRQRTSRRSFSRAYLSNAFLSWFREHRAELVAVDDDAITIAQAAAILGIATIGVHALVRYKVLQPVHKDKKIYCKGGYPRKGTILSRKQVEWYKAMMAGEIPAPEISYQGEAWLPRVLIAVEFPRCLPYLGKHGVFGETIKICKCVPWPDNFRYARRKTPLGYCKADLETLDALLAAGGPPSALDKAKAWLQHFLGGRSLSSAAVKEAAKQAGIAAKYLHGARRELSVTVDGYGRQGTTWSLGEALAAKRNGQILRKAAPAHPSETDVPHEVIDRANLQATIRGHMQTHELLTQLIPDRNVPQYVTLAQIANYLQIHKQSLQKMIGRSENPFPAPAKEGGGGKAALWIWSKVRPWLATEFDRILPETFPRLFPV